MNETAHLRSVLVVDDDATFRERLVRAFQARGFEARGAGSLAEAVLAAEVESPEYAVIDLRIAEENGLEVVRSLHTIDPATRIVVLTGYGSIATALEAVRLGALHYLTKPADLDEILAALERNEAADVAGSPATIRAQEAPSLARVEWEHINRVLVDCGGNVSQAARVLGLHRRSLQRKLSKRPVKR